MRNNALNVLTVLQNRIIVRIFSILSTLFVGTFNTQIFMFDRYYTSLIGTEIFKHSFRASPPKTFMKSLALRIYIKKLGRLHSIDGKRKLNSLKLSVVYFCNAVDILTPPI